MSRRPIGVSALPAWCYPGRHPAPDRLALHMLGSIPAIQTGKEPLWHLTGVTLIGFSMGGGEVAGS